MCVSKKRRDIHAVNGNQSCNGNKQNGGKIYVKEGYFFHGTDVSKIDSIARFGFDQRLSKVSGLFGCGIYFSDSFAKSLYYLRGNLTSKKKKCV